MIVLGILQDDADLIKPTHRKIGTLYHFTTITVISHRTNDK